jgi:hypothetical protein
MLKNLLEMTLLNNLRDTNKFVILKPEFEIVPIT